MLRIVFKNGEITEYPADTFTDYTYDRRCFIVIREKQWVGIYNMDCIACVEFESEGEDD